MRSFFFVKISSLVEYRDFSRKDKPERFCKFELISFRFSLCTLLVSIDFVISRNCESRRFLVEVEILVEYAKVEDSINLEF